jgi:hypothetical protein
MTFDVTESGVVLLKNLVLWGFVTFGGQRIGITFWATHVQIVFRSRGAALRSTSNQELMGGVEAAAREKKSTALGATLDATTHVMRSTCGGATVRAVSIAVVRSSQIRLAVQKKDRLYATDPGAAQTPTDIAGSVWSLRTRVLHFARASLSLDQLIRPRGKSAGREPSRIDVRVPRSVFESHRELTSAARRRRRETAFRCKAIPARNSRLLLHRMIPDSDWRKKKNYLVLSKTGGTLNIQLNSSRISGRW